MPSFFIALPRSTLRPVKSQHLPLPFWSVMPVFFTSMLKFLSFSPVFSWLTAIFWMPTLLMALRRAFSVGVPV